MDSEKVQRCVELIDKYNMPHRAVAERLGVCRVHVQDIYSLAKFEETFGFDPHTIKRRCPSCDAPCYVHRVQRKTPTIQFRCYRCYGTFKELVKPQVTSDHCA